MATPTAKLTAIGFTAVVLSVVNAQVGGHEPPSRQI